MWFDSTPGEQAREQSLINSQHSPLDWGYTWPCSSVGRAAPQSGVRSPVRVRPRPSVYTHLSRGTDLLTPRKDGERPKGHGADCGKTLYRRLTVSVMRQRRETAPCLQYRKCGWLQRPTTGGKPPVYAALQLHETGAAPPGADPGPPSS